MTTHGGAIEVCDYLRDCAAYGEGIRILRQDKWEALCSFIISQCNNIPRIKGIVEKLCSLYGDAVEAPWGEARSFPSAERVAELDEADLAPLHSGYRAPYILAAAKAVASGKLDLEKTASCPARRRGRSSKSSTAWATRSRTAWCSSACTSSMPSQWTSG